MTISHIYSPVLTGYTSILSRPRISTLYSPWSDLHARRGLSGLAPAGNVCLVVCAGRSSCCRGSVPRQKSNIDYWIACLDFYYNSLALSMGSMVLNLLCTCAAILAANLPHIPPVSILENDPPRQPCDEVSQSHHSTSQARRHRSPTPRPRRGKSSSSESQSFSGTPKAEGEEVRRRSPHKNNQAPRRRSTSTSQKIRDLEARLDAIDTSAGALVTVDALIWQIEPPFTNRVMRARVSSRFKLPIQLGVYEGKTDPINHLNSYKSIMTLQGCSNEVMCKAFSTIPEGVNEVVVLKIIAWNHRLIWRSEQRETELLKDYVKWFNQAILEVEDPNDKVSKAEKYIAAEELAKAKCRRRWKDEAKKQKTDPRKRNRNKYYEFLPRSRAQHRRQLLAKRTNSDLIKKGSLRKYVTNRPPSDSLERRYGDNRPTARDIQVIHGRFGSSRCSSSSKKRHARNAHGRAEKEVYNLSSPFVDAHPLITFNNDDLRGCTSPTMMPWSS
ncbi:hypothetical protein Acr_18g0008900 [Actinidia rufa]|uniref:Uncharacterized protein n=1 Tax=Actinidia rufa TaxID=165716 RepID=A0A7J0G7E8_9ERIC|nr:hypothetical protein Acr_18g0008900 [Actinidia rufa]